ncbi:MAG: hypothetical protein SGPRY_013208, partial [Prymnesium sp.]
DFPSCVPSPYCLTAPPAQARTPTDPRKLSLMRALTDAPCAADSFWRMVLSPSDSHDKLRAFLTQWLPPPKPLPRRAPLKHGSWTNESARCVQDMEEWPCEENSDIPDQWQNEAAHITCAKFDPHSKARSPLLNAQRRNHPTEDCIASSSSETSLTGRSDREPSPTAHTYDTSHTSSALPCNAQSTGTHFRLRSCAECREPIENEFPGNMDVPYTRNAVE